jgi:hypothetical protein
MTTVAQVTDRGRRTIAALALAGAMLVGLVPGSASGATAFRLDVSDRGDFVAQTNFVQCVGASMQMMINMIEPGRDRSAGTQLRLQQLARTWSGSRPDGRQRQGASVRGWAAGLNILGAGPYRLVGTKTLGQAMRTAAKAIADTGRPVGLLVWRGRHAWVMSGFVATADPGQTNDFKVTRAIVHDPLYPHGNAVWGPSPSPGQVISISALGRQFVPRRMSNRLGGQPSLLGGKYVLVLPYELDLSVWSAAR